MTYNDNSHPLINKHLALRLVLEAKAAHLKWLAYGLALVEGLECPPGCAPLSPEECEFGKWYY
ncbi:MAG TPA: CZB domain-containing protein, partial [Burkholderiales bacterium]|nr:CZB domain-containing protein [Burkholderiales bacterium]